MDPDRWRRLNDLFEDAVERTPEGRPPFLVDLCGGDAELCEEVARLVRAHERATGFLAEPAVANARRLLWRDPTSAPIARPHRTDQGEAEFRGTERYRVLRRLGAGGTGVVYAVHDGVRDEAVAFKSLRRAHPADVSRLVGPCSFLPDEDRCVPDLNQPQFR